MLKQESILLLTKKYIIDALNVSFFSNSVSWDGQDQYNEIPIITNEKNEVEQREQRGAFLVHRKYNKALRILVTVWESGRQQVCYRIKNTIDLVSFENPHKICHPMDVLLDFSICDLNLGQQDPASYSFYDSMGVSRDRVFALLRFLLDSMLLTKDDNSLFKDLLLEEKSLPPLASDAHFQPVYGVISERVWE